ncbi:MAG: SMI1/KNR4 family protein [Bdellovibrionota bacterium]
MTAHGSNTTVAAKIYDQKGFAGTLAFEVGGVEVSQCKLTGSNRLVEFPLFDWPATTSLSLSGTFAARPSRWLGPKKGRQEWTVVDLAPLLAPLRDSSMAMPQRVLEFFKSKSLLEAHYPELLDASLPIEIEDRCAAEDLANAEARIGFALPREHRELLEEVGQLTIDNSYFMTADTISPATDQIMRQWKHPPQTLERLPRHAQELLDSSTILFTDCSDGFAGLLCHRTPRGEPEYYRIHETTLDAPEILTKGSGEMRSFTEALVHTIARTGLSLYEASAPEVVFRDSSASEHRAYYRLEPEQHSGGFSFRLRLDWEKYE